MKQIACAVAVTVLAACSGSGSNTPPTPPLAAPAGLTYSANPASYVVGTAVASNTPASTGGAIASYAVSPALPGGLALDPASGIVSGTPTVAAAAVDYQVTATNAAGSASVALNITVAAGSVTQPPGPPPVIELGPASQDVAVGMPGFFEVLASGTGTLGYQWFNGNTKINGFTTASFMSAPAVAGDDGAAFKVEVTDVNGTTASAPATLHVVSGFSDGGGLFLARERPSATSLGDGTIAVIGGIATFNRGRASVTDIELYADAPKNSTFVASLMVARAFHTATLLPSGKILIAGGTSDLAAPLASAELYDRAGNSTAPTGNLNHERQAHTATLLQNGTVLVAGGLDSSGNVTASAEIYDPETGVFTATGSLLSARDNHTATLLPNGQVLIAGGSSSGTVTAPVAQAELYDPDSGTFTATGSLHAARIFQAATLLPDGRVLVAGGIDASGPLASAELYDATAGTFATTGDMTAARSLVSAALLPSGKVFVEGEVPGNTSADLYDPVAGIFTAAGAPLTSRELQTVTVMPSGKVVILGGSDPAGATQIAGVELYDSFAGTCATTGDMTAIAEGQSSVLLPNGKVLFAGGVTDAAATVAIANAQLYDPAAGTFTATGSLLGPRTFDTATVLPNGKVLFTGAGEGINLLLETELYDIAAGTFSAGASLPAARTLHAATPLANGKVLIAGGSVLDSTGSNFVVDQTALLYDPAANSFTPTGSMVSPHSLFSATLLLDGRVLITGGFDGTSASGKAELYDPATGTFTATGDMTTPRRHHTATLLADGRVLVAGGFSGAKSFASAEIYDPVAGTFTQTGSLSTDRFDHSATILPDGKVLIAAGNESLGTVPSGSGVAFITAQVARTEVFDPATGTFQVTGNLNETRFGSTATLLANGKVLIAGGQLAELGNTDATAELFRWW